MSCIEIEEFEKSQMKESLPEINVGDTVIVDKVIVEGKKKRIQKFEGTVILRTGIRSRDSIVVRKVVDGIGVEKTYLLHSSLVSNVTVKRKGKVRRARLYYLRDRIGSKATRIKAKG